MTIDTIITALFVIVMIANVVALARHFMLMRMMTMMLNGFAETQNAFNAIMEEEQRQRRDRDAQRAVDP
jgi:hypothetical protein